MHWEYGLLVQRQAKRIIEYENNTKVPDHLLAAGALTVVGVVNALLVLTISQALQSTDGDIFAVVGANWVPLFVVLLLSTIYVVLVSTGFFRVKPLSKLDPGPRTARPTNKDSAQTNTEPVIAVSVHSAFTTIRGSAKKSAK